MFTLYKVDKNLSAVVVEKDTCKKRKHAKEPFHVFLVDETGSMTNDFGDYTRFWWAMKALKGLTYEETNFAVLFFTTGVNIKYHGNHCAVQEHKMQQGGTDITQSLLDTMACFFPNGLSKELIKENAQGCRFAALQSMKKIDSTQDEVFSKLSETFNLHLILVTDGDDESFTAILEDKPQKFVALQTDMQNLASFTGIGIGECNSAKMGLWESLHPSSTMYKVNPKGLEDIVEKVRDTTTEIVHDITLAIPRSTGDPLALTTKQGTASERVVILEDFEAPEDTKLIDDSVRDKILAQVVEHFIAKALKTPDSGAAILDSCADVVKSLYPDGVESAAYDKCIARISMVLAAFMDESPLKCSNISSARVESQSLSVTDDIDVDEDRRNELRAYSRAFSAGGRSLSQIVKEEAGSEPQSQAIDLDD